MSLLPSGVKIPLALDVTDMRKGLDGLAMLMQRVLRQDALSCFDELLASVETIPDRDNEIRSQV